MQLKIRPPYIMFVDENTHYYDAFSVNSLHRQINAENSDFTMGNVVNFKEDNYYNTFSIYNDSNAKILKRESLNNKYGY